MRMRCIIPGHGQGFQLKHFLGESGNIYPFALVSFHVKLGVNRLLLPQFKELPPWAMHEQVVLSGRVWLGPQGPLKPPCDQHGGPAGAPELGAPAASSFPPVDSGPLYTCHDLWA